MIEVSNDEYHALQVVASVARNNYSAWHSMASAGPSIIKSTELDLALEALDQV